MFNRATVMTLIWCHFSLPVIISKYATGPVARTKTWPKMRILSEVTASGEFILFNSINKYPKTQYPANIIMAKIVKK